MYWSNVWVCVLCPRCTHIRWQSFVWHAVACVMACISTGWQPRARKHAPKRSPRAHIGNKPVQAHACRVALPCCSYSLFAYMLLPRLHALRLYACVCVRCRGSSGHAARRTRKRERLALLDRSGSPPTLAMSKALPDVVACKIEFLNCLRACGMAEDSPSFLSAATSRKE